MSLRERFEDAFTAWSTGVLGHRKLVIAASLFVIGVLSTGLGRLEIETSFESYLPRANPAQQLHERFREEFGSGERIVVLLQPESLYDLDFLNELRALHFALEENLPYLDDLTSLVNARILIGESGTLISEGLLDQPARNESDLSRLRERLRANPIYQNVIISADQSATALIVELDGSLGESGDSISSGSAFEGFEDEIQPEAVIERGAMLTTKQSDRLVEVLEGILADYAPSGAKMFVAGTPLLAHRMGTMLTRDILLFVSASLVLTALLLFALFRNIWATIHPLLVVGLSVIGTLGWMGLRGIPITAVTEILPSLLVAVGVGDAVHIQAMFYKRREDGDDVSSAIEWSMGHSGLAVLLTSLTTAASMAAFQAAELQPLIDLGRVAPVGVGLALVLSITLLPALLSLTPMDPHSGPSLNVKQEAQPVDRILLWLGGLGMHKPLVVVVGTGLLLILAVAGAAQLRFSQDDLKWLPEDDSIRLATEELNRSMRGAEPLELYIQQTGGLDLREPRVLDALREIEERAAELQIGPIEVAQSLSLIDVLEETHRALTEGTALDRTLPETREAVSQELLLFEMAAPDDLARLVDTDWSKTRIAMTVPFVDALYYPRFADAVADLANDVLRRHGLEDSIEIAPTGMLVVAGETFRMLFVSMARSYAIAFGVIMVLMLVLIGDLKLGLLSTIPNLTPILLVLGLMGWVGADLDISSMLVGGILIGVVVDDTIHFAHNFGRYRSQTGCSYRAIQQTLMTTGRAMLVTSTVLSIGFFAFVGASLSNISAFGLYCGIGVILAFLADIVLLPALISVAAPCKAECSCRERARATLKSGAVLDV